MIASDFDGKKHHGSQGGVATLHRIRRHIIYCDRYKTMPYQSQHPCLRCTASDEHAHGAMESNRHVWYVQAAYCRLPITQNDRRT